MGFAPLGVNIEELTIDTATDSATADAAAGETDTATASASVTLNEDGRVYVVGSGEQGNPFTLGFTATFQGSDNGTLHFDGSEVGSFSNSSMATHSTSVSAGTYTAQATGTASDSGENTSTRGHVKVTIIGYWME